MNRRDRLDAASLERDVTAVADILRALGNERRLMILCKLVEWGEANVGTLADAVGLSQSALSQHLAKMRDEGLLAFRRESQTVWYRIADPRIERAVCHASRPVLPSPPQQAPPKHQERSPSMTLRTITPVEAQRLVDQGAVLVDIREADEHARERIPGARHIALSKLDEADFAARSGQTVISSLPLRRAHGQATAPGWPPRPATGARHSSSRAVSMPGARPGCRPIVDRRQPIELQRQVQIAAGALAFIGTLLALTVSIWFLVVPLVVGTGLMFAGLTGLCGMALPAATRALEPGRDKRPGKTGPSGDMSLQLVHDALGLLLRLAGRLLAWAWSAAAVPSWPCR